MSAPRRLAKEQPESFAFTPENLAWIDELLKKYPADKKRSGVIPILWRAQKQNGGWVTEPMMRVIGELLDMAYIRVYEVATFYTMFNLEPVGEFHLQLCGTTPCWLRGADQLKNVCKKNIGPNGSRTQDGKLSWIEVECLGACANAPMIQINDYYFEDLDEESLEDIIADIRKGVEIKPGSRRGRTSSEPEGELSSLSDESIYDPAVAVTPVTLKSAGDA